MENSGTSTGQDSRDLKNLQSGVLDGTVAEDDESDSEEPTSPMKRAVGHFLSNWKWEMVIVLLIFCDLATVAIEVSIDYNILCVGGAEVPMGPGQLTKVAREPREVAEEHSPAMEFFAHQPYSPRGSSSGSLQPSTVNKSAAYFWQGDLTARPQTGAVMLQVSSPEGVAKIAYVVHEKNDMQQESSDSVGSKGEPHSKSSEEVQPSMEGSGERELKGEQQSDATGPEEGISERKVYHIEGKPIPDDFKKEGEGEMGQPGENVAEHEGGAVAAEHGGHESALICQGKHGETLHHIAHACHLLSCGILVVFLVELLLKAWVNFHHFIHSKLHVLDFAVVSVSLIVDTLLPVFMDYVNHDRRKVEMYADIVNGLLVVLRIWRIVRVFHGIFNTVQKGYNYMQELKEIVKDRDAENARLKAELQAKSASTPVKSQNSNRSIVVARAAVVENVK
jgi:hypothetical protein